MLGVYVAVFLVGMVTSRIAIVGARGGVQHRGLARSALGALATIVTLSLVIWGFVALPWYWPVALFVGGSVLAALIVTRNNWTGWFSASAVLDVIAAVGGLYLWMRHWPFA